ncbi:hypothetical protein [Pseudomonas sp. SLFW]|uniref:hypothetical protein n=1 Tax=Pseudomonas sp. SLFW TaxID=2683259 RepID=UPI001411B82B|nr:hypothetical protein [Pseudomonas sp. SLFW]NBB09541.1 hypothetical protein [Pseudomonas sp. SLFW]
MSKTKSASETAMAEIAIPPESPLPSPAEPEHTENRRVFRDRVYTSRVLVMDDDRTIEVSKGQAVALDDQQYDYLNAHPEMKPLQE